MNIHRRFALSELVQARATLRALRAASITASGARARLFFEIWRAARKAASSRQSGTVTIAGLRISYDDSASLRIGLRNIFGHRIYHFEASDPSPRIIDCGSHIGLSVLFFKRLYPGSRIVAIEPDPRNVYLLRENLQQNAVEDVTVVNAAIATTAGRVPFVSEGESARIAKDAASSSDFVSTVRLQPYLDEAVSLLKLNIEGMELEVLRDSIGALHKVEQMIIEYHGFAETPQYLHQLLALLDTCRFRYLLHDFDVDTNPATKPPFRLSEQTRFFLLIYARRLR